MNIAARLGSVAAAVVVSLCAASAHGETLLTFGGGNDSALTITLNNPIAFVVDQTPVGGAPFFVFENVGNDFAGGLPVTGSLTYTINGGAAQSLLVATSGSNSNAVTPGDLLLYGALPGVALTDAVTLNAGTLTTTDTFAGPPPAGGPFTAFLADSQGNAISLTNPVPEPSTWALVAVGLAILAAARVRSRRTKRSVLS